jgi:signal peptidase I
VLSPAGVDHHSETPVLAASRQQVITALLRESKLLAAHPVRFRVTSPSMYPLLLIGDSALVEVSGFDSVRPGDLVLYHVNDHFNCHRLIRKVNHNDRRLLLTQGDSNLGYDPDWDLEALFGKVVAIERAGKLIRLDTRKWRAVNHIVAVLLRWQTRLWRGCRFLKRAVAPSGETVLPPLLVRCLQAPARLCLKAVLAHE